MAEVKYEKPLEYYTVDNFIKESRKLIGKPVSSVYSIPSYDTVTENATYTFATTMGEDNPLYTDFTYASSSCWRTLIAPPTFLVSIKFPVSYGALYDGPYPLVGLEAGFSWEWFDAIRMNDKLTGELVLKDVHEKTSEKFKL